MESNRTGPDPGPGSILLAPALAGSNRLAGSRAGATADDHVGDLAAHGIDKTHGLVHPAERNIHDHVRGAGIVVVVHAGDDQRDLAITVDAGAPAACGNLHDGKSGGSEKEAWIS